MLNWIKFIAFFLLSLFIVITAIVFYNANKPFYDAQKTAIEAVKKTGQLISIDKSEVFNGTISMVTVYGKDEEGTEKALFVDVQTNEVLGEVVLSKGIQPDAAIETVKKELKVHKLLHVSLGLEEDHPVWEVAFQSENGKLNYVYVFFENGEWWKRILNL
ncbi:DUF5590 domain-containing protein [Sporosarcina contaminans]|uniref:DUF5590 domain-containing protein n=1 Tax=Sporosarcina contaminans TaxID=633403 RepID=A0ABW3TTU2_9BACL